MSCCTEACEAPQIVHTIIENPITDEGAKLWAWMNPPLKLLM